MSFTSTSSHTCVYINCTNTVKNNRDVTFFKFPVKDLIRCEEWKKNCGNILIAQMDNNNLRQKVICEEHFLAKDILRNSVRKMLQKFSVPIKYVVPEEAGSVDEFQSQRDMSGTSNETNNASNENETNVQIEPKEEQNSMETEEESLPVLSEETQEMSNFQKIEVQSVTEDNTDCEIEETTESEDLGIGDSSIRITTDSDGLDSNNITQSETDFSELIDTTSSLLENVAKEAESSVSDSKRDSLENIDPEYETAKEVIPQEITGIEESDELVTVSEANLNNDSRNLNEGKDTYMEDLQDKPSEEYTVNDNKIADLESIPDNKGVGNDSQDDSHREISDEMILDSESMIDSLQEVDEASHSTSHRNGADFIHVNMDTVQNCSPVYKDGSSSMDKDEESGELGVQQDPIGDQDIVNDSDIIIDAENAREHGADEELCIIPDTERVISQAEKDAASAVPKLRDITEYTSKESRTDGSTSIEKKNVFRNEGDNEVHTCENCVLEQIAKFKYSKDGSTKYICSDECLNSLKTLYPNEIIISGEGEIRVKDMASCMEQQKMTSVGQCATCCKETDDSEDNLTWEFMDFCNQSCLLKHQQAIGSKCSNCSTDVPPNSLGKYAVRFGNDIRQFCTSHCLEEYKKRLKLCSYCQQDMSGGSKGFLSPAVEKGQLKDFCSQICMEKYDIMTNNIPPKVDASIKCCVCAKDDKPIAIDFSYRDQSNYFCGEHCFVAFSFVNKISAGKCAMCKRNFTRHQLENFTMFHNNVQYSFCSNSCQNIFIVAHRKIAPCSWCKVKKFNFDMIRTYSQPEDGLHVCSVNCLSLYQASVNTPTSKKVCCDFCLKQSHLTYRLIMSDATIRKFCSYSCCTTFKGQLPETPVSVTADGSAIVPIGAPRKSKNLSHSDRSEEDLCVVPLLSSIQNLSNTNGNAVSTRSTRTKSINQAIAKNISVLTNGIDSAKNIQEVKQQIIVKPCPVPQQRNVATLTKVRTVCKNTNTKKIDMVDKEVQTDKREKDKILIPVPVPISVPVPLHMYTTPVVYPVPFPLPIPIPIFIPTTRNSANGIMKEIKKIQVKIPSDPYEAELLMMAEMVAGDKKEENSDSESDVDESGADNDVRFTPEPVDSTNTFGDDMLQMALKMATELEEPAVDLEGALTANTITATAPQESQEQSTATTEQTHLIERQPIRGRKRGISRGGRAQGGPSKRGRKVEGHELLLLQSQQKPPEPVEKPDVNMCLKYTFGVNAWKQWVTTKNSELEKSSRRLKLFKTELLQLSADELNYSLCLFVKEVRKPNGAEYAPDTIYYLCLGIQQYLFENGRIDNIFCHPYYEKFTDCLDEVARKFSVLYNDSQYIVTRVEEEHLWESKQLGAHSPHVLLSTLMFFNTKDFNLTTVDEHMQLSFSHIMKHWKRNPNHPGASRAPGSRNVLLRFYPPQSSLQNNTRKKKVYEQQENEESPLRCPVKLYEFYLSKCPESVKTRNDVFYLQPERSCVPDSPVWYSTMPLPRESLEKMLHRVKMVKEINVALLTT